MKKKSGKKHGAFSSTFVKSTDILLLGSDNPWQGRETDRQADNIHKVLPLRRHQCLNWTFYIWQRKRCREKKIRTTTCTKKYLTDVPFHFTWTKTARPSSIQTTRGRADEATPKWSRWCWPFLKTWPQKGEKRIPQWQKYEEEKVKKLRLPVKR